MKRYNHKLFPLIVKIEANFVCFSFSDEAYVGCYKDTHDHVMTHEFTAPSKNDALFFFSEYSNAILLQLKGCCVSMQPFLNQSIEHYINMHYTRDKRGLVIVISSTRATRAVTVYYSH